MKIKSNLRKLMFDKNINMVELSKATGISRVAISKLYHQEATLYSQDTILTLCSFFNCKIGDLLEIVEEEQELKIA